MDCYEVFNAHTGYSFGYYMAETDTAAIQAMLADCGDPQATTERIWAGRVDIDAAAAAMDDEIREDLHGQEWASEADFLNEYEIQHFNKFGEEFVF